MKQIDFLFYVSILNNSTLSNMSRFIQNKNHMSIVYPNRMQLEIRISIKAHWHEKHISFSKKMKYVFRASTILIDDILIQM